MRNRVRHPDTEEEVQLEPKVMEVLLCLAERAGKTVTKEKFKEEVWTDTVVTDDVVSRCILQLRKVFGDDARDPTYIETIRKTGYRLIATVRELDTDVEDTTHERGPAFSGERERNAPGAEWGLRRILRALKRFRTDGIAPGRHLGEGMIQRKWLFVTGFLVGAFLLGLAAFWFNLDRSDPPEAPAPARPFTSFPGEEFAPALSSNGKQIAFVWRSVDSLYQNVYLMQEGAERPLRLSADSTIDRSPSWSPDGRFVAYVRMLDGDHEVRIVPSIGGRGTSAFRSSDRRISDVSWSPDTSRRALVVSVEQRPHQAYSLRAVYPGLDSTAAVTTPPLWSEGDTRPVFSPEGARIAFVRGLVNGVDNLFVVSASGGEPTQVTSDSTTIHGVAWSRGGSHLLYSARREGVSGLWEVDVDGGTPSLVRSSSDGTLFRQPTTSSDRLAYSQTSSELDVWTLRRPNRAAPFRASSLVSSTQVDTHPSISPTGDRVAFVSDRSGVQELWIAESDGSSPAKITSLAGPRIHSVQWSPNGSHLSIVVRKNGQSDVYVVPVEGGTPTQVTDTETEEVVPRWSRDGRWIYFASNRTGAWEIWRTLGMSPDQRAQQVTVGGGVAAQESMDASTLYFVRPDTTGIWAVPLDTTEFPMRTAATGPAPVENRIGARGRSDSLGIGTPDTSQDPPLTLEPDDSDPAIRQVVDQFRPENRSDWDVSGEGIYFLYRRQFQTMVLAYHNLGSNQTIPLHAFPDWRSEQQLSVGPNGEWFAYTHVVRRESDLMLVEEPW